MKLTGVRASGKKSKESWSLGEKNAQQNRETKWRPETENMKKYRGKEKRRKGNSLRKTN